jgi:hypothetical protein
VPEDCGHSHSRPAEWCVVLEMNRQLRAAAVADGFEVHRSRIGDIRIGNRLPPNDPVFHFVDDAGIPLHSDAARSARDPVGAPITELRDLLEMGHESWQLLQAPPEAVDLIDWSFKTNGFANIDASISGKRRSGALRLAIREARPVPREASIDKRGRRRSEPGTPNGTTAESVGHESRGRRETRPPFDFA